MVVDSISNYINKIKNASLSGKTMVEVPFSNVKMAITDLLEQEGFVKNETKRGKKPYRTIEIGLIYKDGIPAIRGVERISRPSKQVYGSAHDLVPVKSGRGAVIVTSSKGVMTDKQARKAGVGGELLFKIW